MKFKFLILLVISFLLNQKILAQTNLLTDTNSYLSNEEEEYIKKLAKQKEGSANIRFCNMIDENTNTLAVICETKEGPKTLGSKVKKYFISPYFMNQPGQQTFQIFQTGNPQPLVKPISFQVSAGDSYTVIIYSENNSVKTMVVNDDFSSEKKEVGRFRAYNFLSEVELDAVDFSGTKETSITFGGTKNLDDLPLQNSSVDVIARASDKSQLQWHFQLNFESTQSISCFLIRDKHNRIRTKIVNDGWQSEG